MKNERKKKAAHKTTSEWQKLMKDKTGANEIEKMHDCDGVKSQKIDKTE